MKIIAYAHIENLERNQDVLQFRNVICMEKIHGSSSNIAWKDTQSNPDGLPQFAVKLFSGGESYEKFAAIFDLDKLTQLFTEKFGERAVTVYGEVYGGKMQGMSKTYGPATKFIAFDVKIDDWWLDVSKAEAVALSLGLEFVDYTRVPTHVTKEMVDEKLFEEFGALAAIVAERNRPSVQAVRNGITEVRPREGIVIRPPFECARNNGKRIVAKFKNVEFQERKTSPLILSPEKQKLITNAQNVAFEFVTPERLSHVLNRLVSARDDKSYSIKDTKAIIDLMVEDVEREGEGEFDPSPAVRKAIGGQTVSLFKKKLADDLRSVANA